MAMLTRNDAWIGVAVVTAVLASGCKSRPPLAPTPPPWLDTVVMEQAQAAGPHELMGDIQKATTHGEDESISTQVPLEMGECYVFSAAGDEGVDELRIYLFNPNGQRVLTQEGNKKVMASFCVTGGVVGVAAWGWGASVAMAVPGMYKVEVKTTEGWGHVAVGAFAKLQPGSAPPQGSEPEGEAAPPAGEPARELPDDAAASPED